MRFQGGYFGSRFNDYFSVSIRSKQADGAISELNTMNGLGLDAFDDVCSTDWREKTLEIETEGDTVQVDILVANVGDGTYDSQ